MPLTPRPAARAATCVIALSALLAPRAFAADALPAVATPAEDVQFGIGLLLDDYHYLALDVLESAWPRATEKRDKARIAHHLSKAYETLSRKRFLQFGREAEARILADYRAKAEKWRKTATQLGGAPVDNLDTLTRRRNAALKIAERIRSAQSRTEKAALLKQLKSEFQTVLAGIAELTRKAKAAKASFEKKEPEYGTKAHKQWEQLYVKYQEPHCRHAVELERTRYEYYKALAVDAGSRNLRKKLLATVIKNLDEITYDYDIFVYSIVGNVTLGEAYLDAGKADGAVQAAQAGLELMNGFKKAAPRVAAGLSTWEHKLLRIWALGHARQGDFAKALDKAKVGSVPLLVLTYAECLLIQAEHYTRKKQPAAAKVKQEAAGRVLDQLAEKHPRMRGRIAGIRKKHGLSEGGYSKALLELERAVAARDNPRMIDSALALLTFGDEVPPDKRTAALTVLGMASYQERQFLQASVVYEHLANVSEDDVAASKYAKYVLGCLQKRSEQTGSTVDKQLMEEARKRLEDKYEGPGVEYRRAGELRKKAKTATDYARVAEAYGQVPEDSLYFEPALHQKGENYVRAAKIAEKAGGNVDPYLAKGKAALEAFLKTIQKPTIHQRVKDRRQKLRSAALYRLADIAMWKGREDHKACLELTKGFVEKYPDAKALHPFVLWLRTRAAIALGEFVQAEVDLAELRNVVGEDDKSGQGGKLIGYATDLLFSAYVKSASDGRAEAEKLREQAAAAGVDTDRGKELIDRAVALENTAHERSDRALTIMRAGIDSQPETATYDKLLFVIYELDRQNRQNELPDYIERFRKMVNNLAKQGKLTQQQREDVSVVRAMHGFALYDRGDYEAAYRTLRPQYEKLDKAWDAARLKNRNAKPDPQYGSIALYFARSAQKLVADPAKGNEYGNTALSVYFKLWGVLRNGTPEWWDVTTSIAETWNALGLYTKNLTAAKRFIATRPDLGGAKVRDRYAGVLTEIYKRSPKAPERESAFQLLVQLRAQDLKDFSSQKRYADMLTVIDTLRALRADLGGEENVENFRKAARFVAERAPDDDVKAQAARMLGQLR
jgi:hypothetical protein